MSEADVSIAIEVESKMKDFCLFSGKITSVPF